MGGIAGHAGVFSTAPDIGQFMQYMITTRDGSSQAASNFLNATTIELFTTIKNVTQSSRAYGWTTNAFRDSENADHGYDHSCGSMSGDTFMHIGYTGAVHCEMDRELCVYV
jgi:CubicO group peptidase (beta-lactamase class C family)